VKEIPLKPEAIIFYIDSDHALSSPNLEKFVQKVHEEYGPEFLCLFRNGDKAACDKIENI
jgi:hypothetical protein